MSWNEGRRTAKSRDVKRRRNKRPSGPESLLDREMTFISLRTFLTMTALYGAGMTRAMYFSI